MIKYRRGSKHFRIDVIIITTVYWEDNNSNKLVPGAFYSLLWGSNTYNLVHEATDTMHWRKNYSFDKINIADYNTYTLEPSNHRPFDSLLRGLQQLFIDTLSYCSNPLVRYQKQKYPMLYIRFIERIITVKHLNRMPPIRPPYRIT